MWSLVIRPWHTLNFYTSRHLTNLNCITNAIFVLPLATIEYLRSRHGAEFFDFSYSKSMRWSTLHFNLLPETSLGRGWQESGVPSVAIFMLESRSEQRSGLGGGGARGWAAWRCYPGPWRRPRCCEPHRSPAAAAPAAEPPGRHQGRTCYSLDLLN